MSLKTSIGAVVVVVMTGLCSMASLAVGDTHEVEIDTISILKDFIAQTGIAKATLEKEVQSRESGAYEFSEEMGGRVLLVSKSIIAKVSVSTNEVVYFRNRSENPQDFPAYDANGRITDFEEIKNRVVNISLEQAHDTARSLLHRTCSSEILEHLQLSVKKLSFMGNHFIYQFAWSEKRDSEGNAPFAAWIVVRVNVTSGHVLSFSKSVTKSMGKMNLSVKDCRRIVTEKYGHLVDFKIEMVTPGAIWSNDKTAENMWIVAYGFNDSRINFKGVCYISDEKGEVVKEETMQKGDGTWKRLQ
jgi:hypothetical protein